MLNSEEIKPIALAVIKLRLSEGVSQPDSQSASSLTGRLIRITCLHESQLGDLEVLQVQMIVSVGRLRSITCPSGSLSWET